MTDLKWLRELAQLLPDESDYQKSFFDIAGFPRWENVNSNLLAFYFDKEEEHHFNTLFIESLLKLIGKDEEDSKIDYANDYEVFREFRTDKGNLVDLVIKSKAEDNLNSDKEQAEENQSSDWAIIIENKIDSWVYNDLEDYWNSVKATHKTGIVLSKRKESLSKVEKLEGIEYHSITHKELIESVQTNLAQYFSKTNEKHLILLKEYINNIDNLYIQSFMNKDIINSILEFQKQRKDIKKLKETEKNILKLIYTDLFKVFENNNFKPNSNYQSLNGKHFYHIQEQSQNKDQFENRFEGFRFWIRVEDLLYQHSFELIFELYDNKNTTYGSKVLEILSKNKIFTETVSRGKGGKDGGDYKHIYFIKFDVNFSEDNFDLYEFLDSKLKKVFFEHSHNFLEEAKKALLEAKEAEKNENNNQAQH